MSDRTYQDLKRRFEPIRTGIPGQSFWSTLGSLSVVPQGTPFTHYQSDEEGCEDDEIIDNDDLDLRAVVLGPDARHFGGVC